MLVKDLNKILKRCGFDFIDEKLINTLDCSSQVFLEMAYVMMLPKPTPKKFEKWTNNATRMAEAIRYLAIAIYLLENKE